MEDSQRDHSAETRTVQSHHHCCPQSAAFTSAHPMREGVVPESPADWWQGGGSVVVQEEGWGGGGSGQFKFKLN